MGNSFSTIWTGWKEKKPNSEIIIQNGKMTKKRTWLYLKKEFDVTMDSEGAITLNTLYFPGWKAFVDTKEVPISYESDGIIHVTVPFGKHVIRVVFADTPVRTIGNVISILSLVGIIGWGILAIYESRHKHLTHNK